MIILNWLFPYLIQLLRSRVVLHVEIAHPSPIPTLSSEPLPIFFNVEDFVQATHLGFWWFIHLKTMCIPTWTSPFGDEWSGPMFQLVAPRPVPMTRLLRARETESSGDGRGKETPGLKQFWIGISVFSPLTEVRPWASYSISLSLLVFFF